MGVPEPRDIIGRLPLMLKTLLCLLAATAAIGADKSWDKVRELKTGTELRIFKREAKQPVLATMDEANEERIVVVVKNEQAAIPKDNIDRIDYRPPRTGPKVTKQTTSTMEESRDKVAAPQGHPGPSSSTSTSFGINSKPDFETIYRRPPPEPKK
jgi:hypothetical protein